MAPDPVSGRRSVSPESSGRDSPIPRQWRSQLGGAPEDHLLKDKSYRRYAAGVDRALSLFETALEEWADYISFLNKLLKALQARPSSATTIPAKALVSKRLSQCLNPSLPSGVHQKTLEVYSYVFSTIGHDGLSRDLPLYLPGLVSTLSFASLSVRSPYLDLLETHFLGVDPRSLRPAMKSIILALLPGLEDETSEDFERTLRIVSRFKEAIRPADSEPLDNHHATGDDYFWQCFFLASITSNGRRPGALAYLARYLPSLGGLPSGSAASSQSDEKTVGVVTSPEPGLLIRSFASGLCDEQLLIQRGFLDLLVSHLPLNSSVLQSKVKAGDLELLLKAAVGVVTRRDMSLNRRLWAWLLGPEPATADFDQTEPGAHSPTPYANSRTSYFEEFGLQALTQALLSMIKDGGNRNSIDRAKPYRICLSLMDRWEIGGLVVPEVFLPVLENVRQFKAQAPSKAEFAEVLRSASVFFDGIESGLIYGELVGLLAQAIGPGSLGFKERCDKLSLINFILTNFNIHEEEMVTLHAPLFCLAALSMLEGSKDHDRSSSDSYKLAEKALSTTISFLELIPSRTFPEIGQKEPFGSSSPANSDLLKKIQRFYVSEQGNLEAVKAPFEPQEIGALLLQKTVELICDDFHPVDPAARILSLALANMPSSYKVDVDRLLNVFQERLGQKDTPSFAEFTSIVQLATELHTAERLSTLELSKLTRLLVRHAWTYLAAGDPKFHVEAVRNLWQLQTSLTLTDRNIEATLAALMISNGSNGVISTCSTAEMHVFNVLWSHTLQDNPSDRRGGKTPIKTPVVDAYLIPRLAGMDHFEVMLTRPVFLVLDSLLDERSKSYMTARSWLNSMIGIDRLFLIFAIKFSELGFLENLLAEEELEKPLAVSTNFSDDDDLDLCLYYLRTLSNVLSCGGDIIWSVFATKHIALQSSTLHISSGGEEGDLTLQDYFVRVCLRCILGDTEEKAGDDLKARVSELQRFALRLLHQFFMGYHAAPLAGLHLEYPLIDRLAMAIDSTDPFSQVLVLQVIDAALKIRDAYIPEGSISSPNERGSDVAEGLRPNRPSITLQREEPPLMPPPPQLLKCLRAALSSPSSRPVLDSWMSFLAQCLPLYTDSIFQILIPLVETLCSQIDATFSGLRDTFKSGSYTPGTDSVAPESSLIYLLNGLEQVLARAHDQLLAEEARALSIKSPDQPQSVFGSMISGVFQSDAQHTRSATANNRLTVHLAFQDATRMCYNIWSWGLGEEALQQDESSLASFRHTSLRMRNRARRLLDHLFTAETLECLETVIDVWKKKTRPDSKAEVFNFLSALEAARPRRAVPALFNAIYSRTNPTALEPSRKSTMTISIDDHDLVHFLVEYGRSLDDDAMDEIWQDCIVFLKDLLSNPFPHRQNLPGLLEFTAILGEKVDNTNFGEQKKMRRELGDLFLKLLAALFTTRPMIFNEFTSSSNGASERSSRSELSRRSTTVGSGDGTTDVVQRLASIVPNLPKILVEPDRVLAAAGAISTNIIAPTFRSKSFPDTVSESTMALLHELSRLQNNQKTWKKDVSDALNDSRFFGMHLDLVHGGWIPLLKQWILTDKDKITEIVSRITPPTTAGIVFGVGATSARLEADRRTQVNLRRIALLVLVSAEDTFVTELPTIFDKLVELLAATSTSSPSSTTRADVYMVIRALVLRISPIHLAMIWPVVNAELHVAISSIAAPENTPTSETFPHLVVLQACKLLDLLICVGPDDFQLHEWLFITDTIDAVHRYTNSSPVALVDELSEKLGSAATPMVVSNPAEEGSLLVANSYRRPLIGPGGINDEVSIERRDELIAKILKPFFGQLSIMAFESTYAMGVLDREVCEGSLLRDLFDDRTIVKAL
ncbi:unnamed protein product [Clonostachys rosea]|uniref:Dopey N-terminal domain-containing protein n=1 Tax=Bionectria ochroleuca TaxID=29856 RepID=A0ABY6UXE7_BIOOC|nr:unnamed protein product [Clonostachys rosea]